MMMRLALATLTRRRGRTALTVAGVAVAAAMLLDMVMLGSGMRESFRGFIEQQGFQLRLTPRGTMPSDTESTLGGAGALMARVRAEPGVEAVTAVLGGQLFLRTDTTSDAPMVVFGVGMDPKLQGDYVIIEGRDPLRDDELVVNAATMAATGLRIGSSVVVAAGFDPQLRRYAAERAMTVVGRGRFLMLGAEQRAAAMPLAGMQSLGGVERADRASVFLVRTQAGVDPEAVRERIEAAEPRVSALSTTEALKFVDERLAYFRQLAFILASVSLAVGFLLVTTLVTVSVNERIGEIAVLRALGVQRWRIVAQVMFEGVALSLIGATLGMALGRVTAVWLNDILSAFPGLPSAFDFFLFEPIAAYRSLGLLVLCGIGAGIWPAWRAATLPIAKTLREEAVA